MLFPVQAFEVEPVQDVHREESLGIGMIPVDGQHGDYCAVLDSGAVYAGDDGRRGPGPDEFLLGAVVLAAVAVLIVQAIKK